MTARTEIVSVCTERDEDCAVSLQISGRSICNQLRQEAQLPQRNSASAVHVCAADALFLCGSSIGIVRS